MTKETPTKPSEAQTFDQKAITLLESDLAEVFFQVPELRSAIVILDYQDPLNEVARNLLWLNSDGSQAGVQDLPTLIGGIQQTLKLVQKQHAALSQNLGALIRSLGEAYSAAATAETGPPQTTQNAEAGGRGAVGQRGGLPAASGAEPKGDSQEAEQEQ